MKLLLTANLFLSLLSFIEDNFSLKYNVSQPSDQALKQKPY